VAIRGVGRDRDRFFEYFQGIDVIALALIDPGQPVQRPDIEVVAGILAKLVVFFGLFHSADLFQCLGKMEIGGGLPWLQNSGFREGSDGALVLALAQVFFAGEQGAVVRVGIVCLFYRRVDLLAEDCFGDRFDQIGVDMFLGHGHDSVHVVDAGHHDEGQMPVFLRIPDPLEELEAILLGHEHVRENDFDLGFRGLGFFPCILAVSGRDNVFVAKIGQHVDDHGERGNIVLDNQECVVFVAQATFSRHDTISMLCDEVVRCFAATGIV